MKKLNLSHLDAQVKGDLDLPLALRVKALLCERFVVHRRLGRLMQEIEFLMQCPERVRSSGIVVVAPPGSGKTMLAQAVKRRYGPKVSEEPDGRRTHHAVVISMTGARDARSLYNRLLEELGAPPAAAARYGDRERELLRALRAFGTRLLVVDEIQDILTSTARQQRLSLDAIKFLMNEASLPVLALGIEKASVAIRVDPHLATRFEHRALPVWTFDDDLRDFLDALEPWIALRYPSNLSGHTIMKTLVDLSKGVLLRLVQLIQYAAIYAILDGRERIDVELLKRAAEYPPVEAMAAERKEGV